MLTLSVDGAAGSSEVKAVVSATERYRVGEAVRLLIAKDKVHLFEGEAPIARRAGE